MPRRPNPTVATLFSFALLSAQQPAVIHGTVVDVNGARIPGAAVELAASANAEPLAGTRTDSFGFFRFEAIPPAARFLQISANGFRIRRIGPLDVHAVQSLDAGALQLTVVKDVGWCGDVFAKPRYARHPAPSASLRGTLADAPFPPDSQIALFPLDRRGPPLVTRPGADGAFVFVRIPPGVYSFRASAPYYRTFEIPRLRIRASTATTVEDLILLPECLPGKACPPIRKTLQESTRFAICL